ncbi:MAG: bifunctional phosphopantothenoylcysteine decarboxylase/phosphopantothenate--cysteine ligase CoaBC [Chitinophagaceae bacterium]|nr:bifunctional phosphopantothenoylcysteine decarboxylase/phosphopantothenate--cysteine ligase CoaBC [Chitinophagaceae bacterium]
MKGKKILIGVCGSIAAYKIPELVRLFIKADAEVKVVLTPAATQFVSPLVLATLSKHNVGVELSSNHEWANHVMLGRWADIMLVAPASVNTIAKMATGLCDNLLLSVYLSATCPIMVAPAMDEDMFNHPSFKQNLATLQSYGNVIVDSEHGELASGLIGYGRMAEPITLFQHVAHFLEAKKKLKGKKALVTAGPTYENLDPVRFIGNYSSGKMGIAIAEKLADEGCEVTLVLGPSSLKTNHPLVTTIAVRSAADMYEACMAHFERCDIAVMSAAVADYTPASVADEKIKKKDGELQLTLTKTKDILKQLGTIKKEHQRLIGFALETSNERSYALNKLTEKNADMIVMNSLKEEGAGFAHDTNKVTIFGKNGTEYASTLKSKAAIAGDIVQKIIESLS